MVSVNSQVVRGRLGIGLRCRAHMEEKSLLAFVGSKNSQHFSAALAVDGQGLFNGIKTSKRDLSEDNN
jgi:hypothetical protein